MGFVLWIVCIVITNIASRIILDLMDITIDSGLNGCINIFALMAGSFLAIIVDFFWKAYKIAKKRKIKFLDAVEIQKGRFLSWL